MPAKTRCDNWGRAACRRAALLLLLGLLAPATTACLRPIATAGAAQPSAVATPADAPRSSAADGEHAMQLIAAAQAGDIEAVKQLLAQGASVDAQDSSGRTALIAAAYRNQVAVAELLIVAGADVNVQDGTQ